MYINFTYPFVNLRITNLIGTLPLQRVKSQVMMTTTLKVDTHIGSEVFRKYDEKKENFQMCYSMFLLYLHQY